MVPTDKLKFSRKTVLLSASYLSSRSARVATSQLGEDQKGDDLEPLEVLHAGRIPSHGAPPSRYGWVSACVMTEKTVLVKEVKTKLKLL